jgi:LuxR family maltose regulon positive regulatory protein
VVEILVLRALSRQALAAIPGSSRELADLAFASLREALEQGEVEGYLRVFLDEGEPMRAMLHQAALRGIAPRYVGSLLAAFGRGESLAPTGAPSVDGLVEPLSPREMDVLRLLAKGLTNPEIAQQLFVSLPTVKSHTSSIYGKLGVHSRQEAVARASELGILPTR